MDSWWLALLLIMLFGQTVRAQFVIANGTLSITSTSRVYVTHHLVNEGKITLDGHLSLTGDLDNRQTLVSNLGTLSLVGGAQTITSSDLDITSLAIRGGNIKNIASNLTIAGELSLELGVVKTNRIFTILSGGTVRGGTPQSYVDGFLYHQGVGQKSYPVGHDGTYAPVTLQNVTGDDPIVGLAYFAAPAFDGTEFHWQQRVLDGTYDGSVAALTFTSENPDYTTYSDELTVLGVEDGSSDYSVLGQASLSIQGNRFNIVSSQPSVLSVLTVGFDVLEGLQNLYLPNAFSPHATDPEDQRVKVYGQKVSPRNFYLGIQDTWGNVVFETTSWEEASKQGWSGTNNRTTQVSPTYRYLLRGAFVGGKSFRRTGTIIQY